MKNLSKKTATKFTFPKVTDRRVLVKTRYKSLAPLQKLVLLHIKTTIEDKRPW